MNSFLENMVTLFDNAKPGPIEAGDSLNIDVDMFKKLPGLNQELTDLGWIEDKPGFGGRNFRRPRLPGDKTGGKR